LFDAASPTQALAPFREASPPTPRHSGILTLCSLLATHLSASAYPVTFSREDAPAGESAARTMARAEAWLRAVVPKLSPTVATAVASYLDGSGRPEPFLAAVKDSVLVGEWQELVLTAGLLSRPEWLAARRT
jgi:hypothetical protein